MSTKITVEEWLSTLEELNECPGDALTITGWAERLYGLPVTSQGRIKAGGWIRSGLEQGWMGHAATVSTTLTGIERRTAGFRLIGEASERQATDVR